MDFYCGNLRMLKSEIALSSSTPFLFFHTFDLGDLPNLEIKTLFFYDQAMLSSTKVSQINCAYQIKTNAVKC